MSEVITIEAELARSSTPMDGGWGYDGEPPAEKLAEAADRPMRFPAWRYAESAGCQAVAGVGVSYAGEVPPAPDRPPADFEPFPTLP